MDIKILTTEIIPTQSRLMVDDKVNVLYKRCKDCFGYEFELYYADSEEESKKIVEKIVEIMESQSEDHGSSWRNTSIELVQKGYTVYKYKVTFRMRDSY